MRGSRQNENSDRNVDLGRARGTILHRVQSGGAFITTQALTLAQADIEQRSFITQKIKALAESGTLEGEAERKAAIMGALMLYLDFINLFLLLLRIFGRRR